MSRTRVGIIGAGNIFDFHYRGIEANPEYELIGICDASPERLRERLGQHNVKGYSDYHDLLAESPDLVAICVPHHLHYPVTLDALAAGCHCLIEKPFAVSMPDARGMLDAATRAKKVLMVADGAYWMPAHRLAHMVTQEGRLGRFLFGGVRSYRFYFQESRPSWFLRSESSGGGMFINLGVHRIAAVRCILGDDPEEKKVLASVHRMRPDSDIEAAAKVFVAYRGGQAVSYEEAGYAVPPKDYNYDFHMVFEKGIMRIMHDDFLVSDHDGKTKRYEAQREEFPYKPLYREALKAIHGDTDYYPTALHGIKDARIALAAYASEKQGTTIDLGDEEWKLEAPPVS